jgi:hypothetical protein
VPAEGRPRWQRRTNVWRKVTIPERGPKRHKKRNPQPQGASRQQMRPGAHQCRAVAAAAMSERRALWCCTALALLLSGSAAHAQQGNLPTPVQKLPAYPPVACVTPDWRSEPCEDRNASLALPTLSALPLLNSRNTPRHIECIKPAEPGWLGLGGFFQLLDCTWLGWTEGVKPFDGRWPAPKVDAAGE